MESLREASQVGERANTSCGETLLHFTKSSKEEWTVKILWGGFAKFRGLFNLMEVQGGYSVSVEEVRSSGGEQSHRSMP
jgi:hypothetical protein